MKTIYILGALLFVFALFNQLAVADTEEEDDEISALDDAHLAENGEEEEFFLVQPKTTKKPKVTKAPKVTTQKPATTQAATTAKPAVTTQKTTVTKKPHGDNSGHHSGELSYEGWSADCFSTRAEYYKKHLALYRDFQAKYAALMVEFQKKNAKLAAEYKLKRAKVCSKKVVKVIEEDDKSWNWAKFSSIFGHAKKNIHSKSKVGGLSGSGSTEHKKKVISKKTKKIVVVDKSSAGESKSDEKKNQKKKKKVVIKKKKSTHPKPSKSHEEKSDETGAAAPDAE